MWGKLWLCVYAVLVLVLVGILVLFNIGSLKAKANLTQLGFLNLFSKEKLSDFESTRSLSALSAKAQELKEFQGCLSPMNIVGHPTTLTSNRVGVVPIIGTTDLRNYFWETKAINLTAANCVFTQERIKQTFSDNEFQALRNEQWQRISSVFLTDYFLQELSVINPSESSLDYLLSFGVINGSSLIKLDDEVIGYFPERYDSDRIMNVHLLPQTMYRLSVLNYSKGNRAPGLAHAQFIGLIAPDGDKSSLFPQAPTREAVNLFSILSICFLSFVLIIFGRFRRSRRLWPIYLAILLVDFALSQSLDMDHIQANLDGSWIRCIRYFCVSIFVVVSAAVNFELLKQLTPTLNILSGYFPRIFLPSKIVVTTLQLGLAMTYSFFIFSALFNTLPALIPLNPLFNRAQFDILAPFLNLTLVLAFLLISAGLALFWIRSRIREDEDVGLVSETLILLLAAGLSYFLYSASFTGFLASTFLKDIVPNGQMYFQSQSLPIIVAAGILILMSRVLAEQEIFKKVVPQSIQEVIRHKGEEANRSSTAYNWIILNDFHDSTKLKAANLGIVTHIHQSNFHKLHKDYFEGCIHFFNSLGDAMLLAIKSPADCQNDDPILEKFVRAYCLHRDGVKMLKSSFDVTIALLKIQNEELFRAIEHQEKHNQKENLILKEFRFRTILNLDYYFYGLNHEISNIDSKSIYLVSKAERAITGAEDGGFIVFPELMEILEFPLSGIPNFRSYFIAAAVDHNKVKAELRAFLPKEVYMLDPKLAVEFDQALTKLYGRELPLRMSEESRSYFEVRSMIKEFVARISWIEDLGALIKLVKSSRPELQNFSEKNYLLHALAEKATALKLWDHPSDGQELQTIIADIGVPQADLFESVRDRDEKYEPKQVLAYLRSNDSVKRNWGIKILRLARVKSAFRGENVPGNDFIREVSEIYLSNFSVFGVESHIYFWRHLLNYPDYLEVFKSLSQTAVYKVKIRSLVAYLTGASSESLRSLSTKLKEIGL